MLIQCEDQMHAKDIGASALPVCS